jgi:hypothetical protein
MTAARIPGFTAEGSLGIFAQEYHHLLVPSGSDSIDIIPTLDFGPYVAPKPTRGCCCDHRCLCSRPCVSFECGGLGDGRCCCRAY